MSAEVSRKPLFRIITYLNQIYIYIHTSEFHNFYIIEKRILSCIIHEIMKKLYV